MNKVFIVGGAGFKKGIVVGETSSDGREVVSDIYTSEDLMASVLHSIGISLETTFTAKNGRPMKIANSGRIIKELFWYVMKQNHFYYLEPNDLQIVLDALEILYNQMKTHQQLGIETPYSQADVEMVLEALKNSNKYKY